MTRLFIALQYLLPQHLLSRALGQLAKTQIRWLKNGLITAFARAYRVDMTDAEQSVPTAFPDFNAFFTRALAEGARPIDPDPTALVSPADGRISECGRIDAARLVQAKGIDFALEDLLQSDAAPFDGGHFTTVYLAPHDYHRVHAPTDARLVQTTAVPGALFSVNDVTAGRVPGLFARNERLVCHFDTRHGPMAVVLVGALIVASIETVWPGPDSPYRQTWRNSHDIAFARGAEIGRFLLGSTVIVCTGPGMLTPDQNVVPGAAVRMGQALGRMPGQSSGNGNTASM